MTIQAQQREEQRDGYVRGRSGEQCERPAETRAPTETVTAQGIMCIQTGSTCADEILQGGQAP
jgi:hypothetical protein